MSTRPKNIYIRGCAQCASRTAKGDLTVQVSLFTYACCRVSSCWYHLSVIQNFFVILGKQRFVLFYDLYCSNSHYVVMGRPEFNGSYWGRVRIQLINIRHIRKCCSLNMRKNDLDYRNISLITCIIQFWWKGVATLPRGARDIHLYFNQHYTYAPWAFSNRVSVC